MFPNTLGKTSTSIVLAIALAEFFLPGLIASGKIEAEILEADAGYQRAVLTSDAMGLAKIFEDDVLIIHSDGTIDNKANFISAMSSGRLKMLTYSRTDVRV